MCLSTKNLLSDRCLSKTSTDSKSGFGSPQNTAFSVTVDRQTNLGRRKYEWSPHLPESKKSGDSNKTVWNKEHPKASQEVSDSQVL